MPGFTSYSVDNDRAFRNALEKAREQSADLRIPFTLIASDFYRSQRAIFSLGGPGKYPDLSAAYKKRKQAKYGKIYPILVANGYLATAASTQGGPGNITTIKAQELDMGVDERAVPYAIYHQSDKPRKSLPLRKFLFIGPEAPQFTDGETKGRLERWLNILDGYLTQTLSQVGTVKK